MVGREREGAGERERGGGGGREWQRMLYLGPT